MTTRRRHDPYVSSLLGRRHKNVVHDVLVTRIYNKYRKLSRHMASMSINDSPLVKQIMLIGLSSAKFLLKGVNVRPQRY